MGIFSRIAESFKEPRIRILARQRPIIAPLSIDRQFSRIGGGLTPQAVSAIMREADTGYVFRLVDLAHEARQKDCHLQSLLGTREAALTSLFWKVTPAVRPGEAVPQDLDREVATFVEAALKAAEGNSRSRSRSLADLVSHLSSGIYFGYGVSEIEWKVDLNGALVPVGFWPVAHRRFRFSQADGSLLWWDVDRPTSIDGISLHQAYPDKFITHQPRTNGDVEAREGLMRVLMWAALFRNWAFTDLLRLAELAWKPWRIGKYRTDASTEEIDDLEDALERLTTNGVATFSDRAEVNVEWPERGQGSRPQHQMMAEFLSQEMSKCVLGQTLTVESGERGARSLGEIHDRVRRDIRENDAIVTAATLRRDLIGPMVRLNFGKDTMIPGFHFITDDVEDLGAYSRAVEGFVRAGLEISQDEVRDKAGFKNPEPGEEILRGIDRLNASKEPPDPEEEIDVDVE